MIKKIIFLLLLICLISCGCRKKEAPSDDLAKILKRGKLIVGVRNDTTPFGFKDEKGNLTGYDIDLAKELTRGLLGDESKVEFVPVTASNRILKLDSGEVDILVATMSVTNQRMQIIDFSKPYYIAGQAILVNKDSKASGLSDFFGKRLIIVFGSISEETLKTSVPEVKVIGFKTYPDAYKALKSGKAEGIVSDDTILMDYAQRDKSVRLLPKRYSKEPYAVAVRKSEESQRLLDSIDYIIDNLQSSGKLFRMQEKWNIK